MFFLCQWLLNVFKFVYFVLQFIVFLLFWLFFNIFFCIRCFSCRCLRRCALGASDQRINPLDIRPGRNFGFGAFIAITQLLWTRTFSSYVSIGNKLPNIDMHTSGNTAFRLHSISDLVKNAENMSTIHSENDDTDDATLDTPPIAATVTIPTSTATAISNHTTTAVTHQISNNTVAAGAETENEPQRDNTDNIIQISTHKSADSSTNSDCDVELGDGLPDLQPNFSSSPRLVDHRWVVLLFGSITSPRFMLECPRFVRLQHQYSVFVDFVIVYTAEAHPTDGWWRFSNNIRVATHKNLTDRIQCLQLLQESLKEHEVISTNIALQKALDDIHFISDNMNDQCCRMLGVYPECALIVDATNYEIINRSGKGPFWFDLDRVESVLDSEMKTLRSTGKISADQGFVPFSLDPFDR